MGFFDNLFRKKKMEKTAEQPKKEKGVVILHNLSVLDEETIRRMKEKYIAVDLETTGLNAKVDRIVEVGMVAFQNGQATDRYETLIDPGILIPAAASAVNHITNEMLSAAPRECVIYPVLVNTLGDVLEGKTILCAHNAPFDMAFLAETLMRHGYSGEICYVDTLAVSRRLLRGLRSYKLAAVAECFEIENRQAHRAASDAETCGKIMDELLYFQEQENESRRKAFEESRPSAEEMEVCAYIQHIIMKNSGELDLLAFSKLASGYVSANYLSTFLKFRFSKKGNYILLKNKKGAEIPGAVPAVKTEGGEDMVRVFFKDPFALEPLSAHIWAAYDKCRDNTVYTIYSGILSEKAAMDIVNAKHKISVSEMKEFLVAAGRRKEERERQEAADAQKRLEVEQEKQQRSEERQKRKEEKELAAQKPKRPSTRAILRVSDELDIVRYESVAAAARENGISDKCIRDAAKGKQKRAGGYAWKYEDEL